MSQAATTINGNSELPYERFRPTPWLWAVVVLYVLVQGTAVGALAFIGGPHSISLWGTVFFLFVVFVPAFALIFARILQEIRIDANTLQWRTLRGWVRVPWSDVSDYYQLNQKEREIGSVSCVVVTSAGKCSFIHGSLLTWSHSNTLREHIRRYAVHARSKDWETYSARPELDWPRTFDYKTPMHRWVKPVLICFFFVWSALMTRLCIPMMGMIAEGGKSGLSGGWNIDSLIFMAPVLFIIAAYPVMGIIGAVALIRTWNSRLTLSEDGLVYSGYKREVSARWAEVTVAKTGFGGMRTTINTTQGSFAISSSIRDYYSIRAALRSMMANAALTSSKLHAPGQSDPASTPHTERSEANGLCLFTYRTPSIASWLRVLTLICIPFCVPLLPGIHQNLPIEPARPFEISALLLVTVTLFGWWRYFAAKITIDGNGITQQTLFGPKRVQWADVEAVDMKGVDVSTRVTVVGANARVKFSALIKDSEDLIAGIERHTNRTLGL